MRRNCWTLALVFYVAALPLAAAERTLPAPQEDSGFVYFTADKATLESSQKKVNLTGNVTLIQKLPDGKKRTITGDEITYDQLNTTISSVGPITLEDGQGSVLRGNNISVNYTTQDFKAEHLSTEYPPLRVLSTQEISAKNGKYLLRKAEVTCCDCEDPHYTLSVGKLTVSPQKRVFGTNAVLKLDGFPVLYLPVFWRSLDSQKPWTTYVDFSQSNKVGFGVLTSSVFKPVLGLRPVLNLDYYTKSGFGIGAGLTAVTSPRYAEARSIITLTIKKHINSIWQIPNAGDYAADIGGKCMILPTILTTQTGLCTSCKLNFVKYRIRTLTILSSAATRIFSCRTRKQTWQFPAKRANPRCG